MIRWSPGRLQFLGYLLGSLGAVLIAIVATLRPGFGLALLLVAALLVLIGAVAIGLAQARGAAR